jgi:hypothetical protein
MGSTPCDQSFSVPFIRRLHAVTRGDDAAGQRLGTPATFVDAWLLRLVLRGGVGRFSAPFAACVPAYTTFFKAVRL